MEEVDPQIEALIEAAKQGDIPKLRELLDSGVSVSALDQWGCTALGNAASNGEEEAIRFLLERGAPIDQIDKNGDTAIFLAAEHSMSVFQTLVDAGADPLRITANGDNAIKRACYGRRIDVARYLLDRGVDPNQPTANGNNALCSATMSGPVSMEMIEFLLAAKTDVNVQDVHGFAPLHHVAERGHAEATKLLLDAGADPDLKCGVGGWEDKPLDLARKRNHTEVVALLEAVPHFESRPSV